MERIKVTHNGHTIEYNRFSSGTHYHVKTPKEVVTALEDARVKKTRIRLFYGDTISGKSWNEENDVMGTVGRSMGPIKIPILLYNRKSIGGCAILDHCIVKIISRYRTLYQHAGFKTGEWAIEPSDLPDYAENVTCDDVITARFKKTGQAKRYIDFMTGKRFGK
jgi:hypothetical protein